MAQSRSISWRASQEQAAQLAEVEGATGRSTSDLMRLAVALLHQHHRECVRQGEERGRAAMGLLRELRRRLGDSVFEGAGEVAFAETGPVAIEAGGVTYQLAADNTITATRAVGGRREVAAVTEGGLDGWAIAAPAAPAMN